MQTGQAQRLVAVGGLGHNADLAILFQELANAFADHGMVIGKQDSTGCPIDFSLAPAP